MALRKGKPVTAKSLSLQINDVLSPGVLFDFAGTSAPAGFLLCDGSAVSRTTYSALFSNIGTTYGVGDGSTTFNLPDSRGRVHAGKDDMGGSAANRLTTGGSGINGIALGANGGAQTHTLSSTEMPSHSHSVTDPGHSHVQTVITTSGASVGTQRTAPNSGSEATVNSTLSNTTGISLGNTGSGGAHNNAQPTLIVNKIIKY